MLILVVGGTGTIGKSVVQKLKPRHEIITAGFKHGDFQVDVNNTDSILKLYQTINQKIDAVVVTTGKAHFAKFDDLSEEQYYIGIRSKLMGQVNLVRIGKKFLTDNGSFTLTSGILNYEPILGSISSSMVNGALEGFVRAAAIEILPIRINLVSPTVITESMPVYENYFRGFKPVSVEEAALAYSKSVEGAHTGQIYRVGYAV